MISFGVAAAASRPSIARASGESAMDLSWRECTPPPFDSSRAS